MSIFDRYRAGHRARNDSPAYDDLKPPKRDDIPTDYGQHPLWCHNTGHDGSCQTSTAVTDPDGVRFKVTVLYDRTVKDPRPQMVVEVGGRPCRLDADKAVTVFGLANTWLAPMSLPHPRPAERSEPQS